MNRPCPICGNDVDWDTNADRPFCSERCKEIDLGNWATEAYTVPAEGHDIDDLEGVPPSETEE